MRVIFMGTPDFSVASAAAIKAAGHDIVAVFTQPDKPKNRGKQIATSPVKDFAVENGIPVYQPQSLKKVKVECDPNKKYLYEIDMTKEEAEDHRRKLNEEAESMLAVLRELAPDVIVVVAYGQILPKEVLELPKFGCVNVHASLLPEYRGAAPIQRCIQDGATRSGVCTMRMDEGLDTGDVIMRYEVDIPDDMTGSQLWEKLSKAGAELICETLTALENGTAKFTKQPAEGTYAKMIHKMLLLLDLTKPAREVYNFIRAMADTPCAYTRLPDGKRLKVYRSKISDIKFEQGSMPEAGTVVDDKTLAVVCGDGNCVEFTEVQPEGGKRMTTEAFLRGRKIEKGTVLK